MNQEPFIICDNLIKIYKVAELEIVALQGLDLTVQPGELMGIVGASGSGKSTLLNILGGLDRPSAGRVWVSGRDLLDMSEAALTRYRRALVGFVWQQGSRNLIPYLNALENVELPMTLAGEAGPEKRAWASELLQAVGLGDRMTHRLGELSGGEQQRVAIAVALANRPALLLADEPTGEVDSTTAQTIYDTFQKLNAAYNLTTLIVSHDPGIAQHVNRVVAIRDGRLAAETLRQASGDDTRAAQEFEELVVLDAAGRLQIPKALLAEAGVQGRARLEVTTEGILVRPAGEGALAAETRAESMVDDLLESEAQQRRGWLRRALWRRRKSAN